MVAIVVMLSLLIPVLEVLLFSAILSNAGMWPIILPSAMSGCAGAVILIRAFPKFMHASVNNDKFQTLPTMQSYHDVSWMLSGLLLLIPGFISDIIALVLLHPKLRGYTFIVAARLLSSTRDDDSTFR